jgi:hypothetical protein
MTTTRKIYKLNTFDNGIIEDYDYYYDENELIETSRPTKNRNNNNNSNIKYYVRQDGDENDDYDDRQQDKNSMDYEYEINTMNNEREPQKYYLIGGKYYTNKPPKPKVTKQNSLSPPSLFNDYSYKIRPEYVKKSPNYVKNLSETEEYNKNNNFRKNTNLELFPEGIYSDYDKPRARIYQPPSLKMGRAQSLDKDNYTNRSNLDYAMFSGSSKSTRSSFNQVLFNKPNHRREIDEPVIRDKPILNKPVIRGGAVIHK